MSRLKVIRAEATVNLCPNPSVEKDLTGWGTNGAVSIVRSAAKQARGAWSCKGTFTAAGNQWVSCPSFVPIAGRTYTLTMRVFVESFTPGSLKTSNDVTDGVVLVAGWNEVVMTVTAPNTNPLGAYVYNYAGGTPFAAVVYIDAVQYEEKAYATSYCDGDQDGCKWTGTAHASTSSREAGERSGGRVIDPVDDVSVGLLYSGIVGVGMPPLQHVTQEMALRDGAILQRIKSAPALLTITAVQRAATLPGLHTLRRALADLLKPDRRSSPRPVRLRYSGSGSELELDVHYVGGLEAAIHKPSRFERMSIQLVSYDPHWREIYDVGASLATSEAIANANRIMARQAGVWRALGTGADNSVKHAITARDGKIYATGTFLNIGGVAANRIAYWDPADNAWHAMGTGLAGAGTTGYFLLEGADGTIYVGGDFTTAGGTTVNRVAAWNPTTSTWSALSTGMGDGAVLALIFDQAGNLFAGGTFTTASGSSRLGIARWTGSTWTDVGGVDLIPTTAGSGVQALAVAPNGDLYAGIYKLAASGASFYDLAKWDGSAWSQVGPIESGSTGGSVALAFGTDGFLYIGGAFATPSRFIKRWNGVQFQDLGTGVDSSVFGLAVDSDGNVFAVGAFLNAGDIAFADRIARWDGATWKPLPVDFPGAALVNKIHVAPNGQDLLVAADFNGSATGLGRTTVSNPGSSEAFPLIRLRGPGTLISIENITTAQEILFNQLPILTGEEIVIDLRPGRKTIRSSVRGNLASFVLAGSDLGEFSLLPGDNVIAVLASGATADLYFRPRHWGAE